MRKITITLIDDNKVDELLDLVSDLPYVATAGPENSNGVTNGLNGQEAKVASLDNGVPITDEDALLDQEVAYFEEQHSQLVTQHLGQYIAMHQGKVIGHHADLVALIVAIEKTHSDATVLYRQVQESLPPTLIFRSPRMVRD